MINISDKVKAHLENKGIKTDNFDFKKFEVGEKGIILFHNSKIRILFIIKGSYDWDKIVYETQKIELDNVLLTYRAGLDKKRFDKDNVFSHSDCYIEFNLKIVKKKAKKIKKIEKEA